MTSRARAIGSDVIRAYEAWNQAIADVVFAGDVAGRPVYLDLETDVLEAIAERLDTSIHDPSAALAKAVSATVDLSVGPGNVFAWHRDELDAWHALNLKTDEAPPVLSLLAVMSLAAEAMGQDAQLASHNYYGRLGKLLGVEGDAEQSRLTTAARKFAHEVWSALNLWIEAGEGLRGVPTAYALGAHQYVGLPISQALVRADDRRRFAYMFDRAALSGGEAISADEMERVIADWVADPSGQSSQTFRSMWARADGDVRSRIAEVAVVELESRTQDPERGPRRLHLSGVRLTALLRRGLGTTLLLGISVQSDDDRVVMEAVDLAGALVAGIEFVSDGAGWLRAADPTLLDPSSLVAADVRLRDPRTGSVHTHTERSLYVLVRDDISGTYVERERVVMASDALVLVRSRLVEPVASALAGIARPGSKRIDAASGLPQGWHLFADVEILSMPDIDADPRLRTELNPLVPIAASQIAMQGGLSLPGLNRKWSSMAPPELAATSASAKAMTLIVEATRILGTTAAPKSVRSSTSVGAVVLDLAAASLSDGDYDVRLTEGDGRSAILRRTLRLRSADSPVVPEQAADTCLAHDPTGALWPIGAIRTGQGRGGIRGAWSPQVQDRNYPAPPQAQWPGRRQGRGSQEHDLAPVAIGVANPASCAVTGSHLIQLPPAESKSANATIVGTCQGCGLVKRYPAAWHGYRAGGLRHGHRGTRRSVTFAVPPISLPEVGWEAVVDGIFHLGGGKIRDLERLASHLDPSAVFAHTMSRTLEATGDIEIARDLETLELLEWEVAPLSLAEAADGAWVVVGRRGRSTIAEIRAAIQVLGGNLESVQSQDGHSIHSLSNLDAEGASQVANSLQQTALVIPRAGQCLLAALPPLSTVLTDLPRAPLPPSRRISIWDPLVARWREVPHADRPGGYKFVGFSVRYGFRTDADIRDRTIQVADARLVKHAAAVDSHLPLVSYQAKDELLVVPMGAELPGLYERAVVLASGRLPAVNARNATTVYPNVPIAIASGVATLMMS